MTSPPHDNLTLRECEVLKLLVEGKRNKEIAKILCIAEHTVESHLRRIFTKLGISSRIEAVLLSTRSAAISRHL